MINNLLIKFEQFIDEIKAKMISLSLFRLHKKDCYFENDELKKLDNNIENKNVNNEQQ